MKYNDNIADSIEKLYLESQRFLNEYASNNSNRIELENLINDIKSQYSNSLEGKQNTKSTICLSVNDIIRSYSYVELTVLNKNSPAYFYFKELYPIGYRLNPSLEDMLIKFGNDERLTKLISSFINKNNISKNKKFLIFIVTAHLLASIFNYLSDNISPIQINFNFNYIAIEEDISELKEDIDEFIEKLENSKYQFNENQ